MLSKLLRYITGNPNRDSPVATTAFTEDMAHATSSLVSSIANQIEKAGFSGKDLGRDLEYSLLGYTQGLTETLGVFQFPGHKSANLLLFLKINEDLGSVGSSPQELLKIAQALREREHPPYVVGFNAGTVDAANSLRGKTTTSLYDLLRASSKK
jgi:hypothetical protein